MIVTSSERSTGMGATRYTAILQDGEWVRVSNYPGVVPLGRNCGVQEYEVEVPDGTTTASFYRSNKGNMSVDIETGKDKGLSFTSFAKAEQWARENFKKQTAETELIEICPELKGGKILSVRTEQGSHNVCTNVHFETENFTFMVQATYEGWAQVKDIKKKEVLGMGQCIECGYAGNIYRTDDNQELCINCNAINSFN